MPDKSVLARSAQTAAVLSLALLIGAGNADAAPWAANPDWPCQQRLVPRLAAASYWNGPPLAGLGDWQADPAVAELVRRLAPRPVTTAEGLTAIAAFARSLTNDRARRLGLAFLGLLEKSDLERRGLLDELQQIGHRQRELAALVANLGAELAAIPAAATGDAAVRRTDLQQRYDFTARNFEEIQRTIRYACDTPVELDARLGAWARALERAVSQ
jgi:hypothetical protein